MRAASGGAARVAAGIGESVPMKSKVRDGANGRRDIAVALGVDRRRGSRRLELRSAFAVRKRDPHVRILCARFHGAWHAVNIAPRHFAGNILSV
jgi:hypothetical protein